MGGYGSTRWGWYFKKETVETCRSISIFDLKRDAALKKDVWNSGTYFWRNKHTNELTARIGYELFTFGREPFFRVHYTITRWDKSKHDYDYSIPLETTPCHFGGLRWWFNCPLVVNDHACHRRAAKLYMPSSGHYFGCRQCYKLTYRKSQESNKRINELRRLDPMKLLEGVESGEIHWLTALRALPDDIWNLE